MGRGRRRNPKNIEKGVRQEYTLTPITKENSNFFEFCRLQKFVPEESFGEFERILKVDLPASFRIQQSLPERNEMAAYLEKRFFSPLQSSDDPDVHCPEKIPFVPFAYQTSNSRATMRSSLLLSELHNILVMETEAGNISRQEAVSMVPPLLLDIKSNSYVLDACASPGSKTAQMVELMHKNNPHPEGIIVANDVDSKRCYLLVHQTLKRLPAANAVVVNHDASQLPAPLDANGSPRLYDRILCDVICSGDGTFRKNPELWRTWTPQNGLNLHKIQQKIARRCLELLEVGGLMAYSTCSLNPMEDEAVLAHMLRTFKGAVELVDVSDKLPELKRSPGLSTWKVLNKDMREYATMEESVEAGDKTVVPSMFPPTTTEAEEFHLERSFRILPHLQNSGGFFVAILRKTAAFASFSLNPLHSRVPQKKRRVNNEDPFVFLDNSHKDLRDEVEDHYGLDANFPYQNLLIRTHNTDKKKGIYFVNDSLRDFMKQNLGRYSIINAGVSVFRKVDKVSKCSYRLAQDGLYTIMPYLHKRIVDVDPDDMAKILSGFDEKHYTPLEQLNDREKFVLDAGTVVVRVNKGTFRKEICAWIGISTITAFITREEKVHILNMLDYDSSALRTLMQTTRKEKAERLRQNAQKTPMPDQVMEPTSLDAIMES